jgi:RimJ/RimL family protein N-acetyltransferase
MSTSPEVRIEPWDRGDLALLEKCVGDPAMMEHLGGPESAERIADRQARYEEADSKQFKVVDEATGEGVGWVGYWERDWQDAPVLEIGWAVLPAFQGRGIAAWAAGTVIATARSEHRRRFLHAFPSIDNAPSNSICRRLGFALLGECEVEYPKGNLMRCNNWRLDLQP